MGRKSKKDKTKELFLEQLSKTPVVQAVCDKIGIARWTAYRWKKEDSEFAKSFDEALHEGNSLVSDVAISQLISAIKDKNLGAIKFWLTAHHPDYTNRLQVTAKVEQKLELSSEQEALVRRALEFVSQEQDKELVENNAKTVVTNTGSNNINGNKNKT